MLLHGVTIVSALSLLVSPGSAHPGHHHHHRHEEEHTQSLRNLNLFSGGGPANGHCKDGEPSFTVGGVTYECKADFNAKGGNCRTPDPTAEEMVKAKADFDWWKEQKTNKGKGNTRGAGSGRRLGGCTGADCAGFDSGKVITIPTHFHVFHSSNDGIRYTCEGSYDAGFVAGAGGAGNCKYVQDQIKAINKGFRGVAVDGFGQYHADTKIQFCLASSNNLYDSSAYNNAGAYADSGSTYKSTHRVGRMETFNVWVNKAGGYLGYATFPGSSFLTDDGVVLLNDSVSSIQFDVHIILNACILNLFHQFEQMPGGTATNYNLGDTLTHEIGHWIGLYHTFQGGCSSSTGDYQHLAGGPKTTEKSSTFGCPTSNPPDTVRISVLTNSLLFHEYLLTPFLCFDHK